MSRARWEQAQHWLAEGKLAAARAGFEALRAEPDWAADALNGLGLCAEASGDLAAAEAQYRAAIALRPEAEFYNNLAICQLRQGRVNDGLASLTLLSQLNPPPEVAYNFALALASLRRYWDALSLLGPLLQRHPRFAPGFELIPQLLAALAQDAETPLRLQRELAAAPEQPFWHLTQASWYDLRKQPEMALRARAAAIALAPELLPVYRPLIAALQQQGRYAEARVAARTLFAREGSLDSLVQLVVSLQQPMPDSEAESKALRSELIGLLSEYAQPSRLATLQAERVYRPAILPYYACYQHGEDLELHTLQARFFASFLRLGDLPPVSSPRARPMKPRLGIFSSRFYRHSVTDLLGRAFETLLASGAFETWIFYYPLAPGREDDVTRRLQAGADHFLILPAGYQEAARELASHGLDLLLFADVGMESYSYTLALQRLARHQLVLPGHPVTTGMATIDYFVSGAHLDPPGAEAQYSEQLLRLPGLPDYERPVIPPPASREALGLPPGRLYFCPMTLFKITPAFDTVMAGILAADPEARVLLLDYKHDLHERLRARFAAQWPALAPRLCFLPWSDRQSFYQRLRAVDVILDSFPFGGGNTAYQAFGLGCPVICLDQPWNKGRWTQALYRMMGLTELIAATPEDYVALAVALAADPERQARLRAEILARNHLLFDNPAWSQGLLEACLRLAAVPANDQA